MTKSNDPALLSPQLLSDIRQLLEQSRLSVARSVNSVIVQTYWQIGRLIVEEEQKGATRAEYGTKQLEVISDALIGEFGKGSDVSNRRNMRQFYMVFPIRDAVRLELSWTHYRVLMRVENPKARALERQHNLIVQKQGNQNAR